MLNRPGTQDLLGELPGEQDLVVVRSAHFSVAPRQGSSAPLRSGQVTGCLPRGNCSVDISGQWGVGELL